MVLVPYRDTHIAVSEVKRLISYAVGSPTDENLNRVLAQVYSRLDTCLYLFVQNDTALGLIGVKRTDLNSMEILHIAVDELYRNQGFGRCMLDSLLKSEGIKALSAETDNDAVGFYRKSGFVISSPGEKYPGVERFLCRLMV